MLLRDAIHIPESVRQGDLVFKLTDATEHTEQTLAQYVVTEQLRDSFLDAAKLVRAAVSEGTSKAAYLSGSFGAGKSNFMGVLQLLLDANPAALAKPELAPVVAQLGEWREDRRFLTVPFHLIGATSLESAIFGGYVTHLRGLHPEAPMPDVFADEPILDNADTLRSTMGDTAFFAALGAGDGDGWGDLGGWDAARYEAARAQPADGDERRLLVQALLDGLLSAYAEGAKANQGGYVDIDSGLAAMSRHAHDLGYAGLILFLDELILWLMSRMADPAFVSDEASKISKLVEASDAARPVPIISLIARQRDLRELVGTDVPGAERLGFINQLDFQAGRFSNIVLDDSNLPVVANQRLLQPVDDDGAAALAEAFASLHLSDDVRDALRGANGTDDDFRLTYPFSPAFLTIVVDVAGALQRTRTGLRVLLELLVANRDTFEVGQLVPVGDLYDVLAGADDPLSEAMKQSFESAKRIYRSSLRPMLLAEHSLTEGAAATPAFTNDDRLVKTLLLAALVPNSEPFRNMTARKLVALNHGLISSPVPGAEVGVVVTKLNNWAARTGELQVGGDAHNPTVHIVLSEVDTRTILDAVSGVDNPGNRRKLVRDLLAEELGVPTDQLMQSTKLLWKGQQRPVELVFGNIRNAEELSDSSFASTGEAWKVVIDFPFDDADQTPLTDLARIESLRNQGHEWRTVCWLPSFFTAEMRAQLGDLVRLNHLLPVPGQSSERFLEATRNLSAESRESARPQLEAQQRAARGRLQQALKQAYGLVTADPAVVDSSHGLADHFPSLLNGFTVQPPVASTLRDAFDAVIAQALEHTYPGAPALDAEVKRADLTTVYSVCEQALQQPDKRIPQVPTADRKVMSRIANPLRLGVQSEQAFLLDGVSGTWDTHFTRKLAEREQAGAEGNATVGELRAWIDQPKAMGLSRELQNLVLLVWAAATDRTFTDHGGPARVAVDSLADHFEVVAQDLPDTATWAEARARAEHVFGVAGLPDVPSAVGLARLSNALTEAVADHRDAADSLVGELGSLDALLGGDDDPNRLRTAKVAAALLHDLAGAGSDLGRVGALVDADLAPSPQAVGASVKAAGAVSGTVRGIDIDILTAALTRPEGIELAAELESLMAAEELAAKFSPALSDLYAKARTIVVGAGTPPATSPVLTPVPPSVPTLGPEGGAAPGVPTPGTGPGPGATGVIPVFSESGLDREAAAKKLKELRKRLEAGEFAGESFGIEITAVQPEGDG
jgi:hypothetical protein